MDIQELNDIYTKLRELAAAGKDEEARIYLADNISKLPQDLQDELSSLMVIDALEREANAEEAISEIREEGMEAIRILNEEKKRLEQKS